MIRVLSHTPKDNLFLAAQLKDAIREDWADPANETVRSGAYSEDAFQKRLRKNYPAVETKYLLKSVGRYMGEPDVSTNSRSIPEVKLDYLIRFIYEDHPDFKWPRVTEILRTYKGGEYAEKVKKYINPPKPSAPPSDGQVGESDLLSDIIKFTIEARTLAIARDSRIKELEYQKDLRDKKAAELERVIATLRLKLARLELAIEQAGGASPEIVKEYQSLQNVLKSIT